MNKNVILCVDDEKIVLDSLKKELKETVGNDYIVEVAESGEEALEIFQELREDNYDIPLVISDYIMPGIKGDELLQKVKEMRSETYRIMLTGQATIEGVTNAINNADLYRYIGKPWESSDMALTVSEALKSYDKDRELELRRNELEIANQKLLKLDSAKTYFLGLLSHELNTPLIGINGNAKLIKELTDDNDIIESAEDILTSEARLRKFSELSLLITRIQTDKYDSNFYEEKLQDIVESTVFNYKDISSAKNVEVIKEVDDKEYFVKIDVSLISKVFEIVLDNAIKFAPENSKVKITGKKENGSFYMSIKDEGSGFSEQSMEHMFEFFSSSGDLMSHSEGSGLSLAAAKVIMEMHSFDIKVRNSEAGGAVVEMIF